MGCDCYSGGSWTAPVVKKKKNAAKKKTKEDAICIHPCWVNGAGTPFPVGRLKGSMPPPSAPRAEPEREPEPEPEPEPTFDPPPTARAQLVNPPDYEFVVNPPTECLDDPHPVIDYATLRAAASVPNGALDFVNTERVALGFTPVVWNDNLTHAGMMHAADMLMRGYNVTGQINGFVGHPNGGPRHSVPHHPWGYMWWDRAMNSGYYPGQASEGGHSVSVKSRDPALMPLTHPESGRSDEWYTPGSNYPSLEWIILNPLLKWKNDFPTDPHWGQFTRESARHMGVGLCYLNPCVDYVLDYDPSNAVDMWNGQDALVWRWGISPAIYMTGSGPADTVYPPAPALFDTLTMDYTDNLVYPDPADSNRTTLGLQSPETNFELGFDLATYGM